MKHLLFIFSILFLLPNLVLAETFTGTYSVPVEEDLIPFSGFSTEVSQFEHTDGKLKIVYKLPPELIGNGNFDIELEETSPRVNGFQQLTGPDAIASCLGKNCLIFYTWKKNRPSLVEAQDNLRKKFSGEELEARLLVTAKFFGEGIGILTVEKNR